MSTTAVDTSTPSAILTGHKWVLINIDELQQIVAASTDGLEKTRLKFVGTCKVYESSDVMNIPTTGRDYVDFVIEVDSDTLDSERLNEDPHSVSCYDIYKRQDVVVPNQ